MLKIKRFSDTHPPPPKFIFKGLMETFSFKGSRGPRVCTSDWGGVVWLIIVSVMALQGALKKLLMPSLEGQSVSSMQPHSVDDGPYSGAVICPAKFAVTQGRGVSPCNKGVSQLALFFLLSVGESDPGYQA